MIIKRIIASVSGRMFWVQKDEVHQQGEKGKK